MTDDLKDLVKKLEEMEKQAEKIKEDAQAAVEAGKRAETSRAAGNSSKDRTTVKGR